MAPIPVLMILYSSDAVEVRYSDGSVLELSPCGSTMIHHQPAPKGEHPIHELTKKIQKRTRYVTSEHRNKVLQALDFRNRFADRPYLCEELMSKEEILTLYAKIDRIAWPKAAEAKIEVLPDGSRRITSVDEYASLIVSPHGQDFTVCYLSQISADKKKHKHTFTQSADSSHSPQPPFRKTQKSLCVHSKGNSHGKLPGEYQDDLDNPRANEAVVHPFKTVDQKHLQDTNRNSNMNNLSQGPDFYVNQLKEMVINQSSDRENFTGSMHNPSLNTKVSSKSPQTDPTVKPDLAQPVALDSVNNDSVVVAKPQTPRVVPPFATGSPNSHEISSISRSSTPDGLRTIVDSDATLTHDSTADSHSKGVSYKQRHSSPTHYTSSPFENPEPLNTKKRNRFTADVSLSGSFLGNQKEIVQPVEDKCPAGTDQRPAYSNQCPPYSDQHPPYSDQCQAGNDQHPAYTDQRLAYSDQCPAGTDQRLAYSDQCPAGTDQCPAYTDQHLAYSDQCPAGTDQRQINTHQPQTSHTNPDQDSTLKNSSGTFSPDSLEIQKTLLAGSAQTSSPGHAKTLSGEKYDSHIEKRQTALSTDIKENLGLELTDAESGSVERHFYVWSTKHGSRSDCSVEWSYPLKLAIEGRLKQSADYSTSRPTQEELQTAKVIGHSRDTDYSHTQVPLPLPLTCPFQHKDKEFLNQLEESMAESSDSGFQRGKLKVIISESVVYRLVQCGDIKMIEVYPGDGSVLVSQGVKGHFYVHYVLVGEQLEERTYSLKSLPPGKPKGRYSLEKLIKTANRFLSMNNQWDVRGISEKSPCWKKEIVAVVEPLSSSLLEECCVEGLGKFSAFTNGRVRVVFEDRAALDLVCNFQRRLSECLQHSRELQTSLPGAEMVTPPLTTTDSVIGTSSARLLLPSGRYVTVDCLNPGPYKKYIQAAHEWAMWVNASPLERQHFYTQLYAPAIIQQVVDSELKRINCFKYMLEHTIAKQNQSKSNQLAQSANKNSSYKPAIAASSQNSNMGHFNTKDPLLRDHIPSVHDQSYPPSNLRSQTHPMHDQSYPPSNLRSQTHSMHDQSYPPSNCTSRTHPAYDHIRHPPMLNDPTYPSSVHPHRPSKLRWSNTKEDEILQGFQNVRQVLLQNSNLIQDIDNFLEKSKSS
ncbi:uncharacterized protein C5orf34 homolog [Physella acuta]|uniref:uncharacterized protein C5orf34 homolog n=1 Tax=Physella acuta TaxID=109671 RepID=UPI0027DB7470|nr:uncharacterized protein C5orf34 homolog [Physella acuta]